MNPALAQAETGQHPSPMVRLARRVRAGVSQLGYRALRWLPLPAQDKWNGSLYLFRLHLRQLYHIAEDKHGPLAAEMLLTESLHQAGAKWAERGMLWSSPHRPSTQVLGDGMLVVVKTLALPSQVKVAAEKVTVTTYFCPFVDDAKRVGEDRVAVCERTCGEYRSLFKGLSDAFPFPVHYRAPSMMGRGHKVCVKELEVRVTAAADEDAAPA